MNYFIHEKPTSKFVAFYSDGSGANLFWRLDDDVDGFPVYCNAEGDFIEKPETYFEDAGYYAWLPLPDDFEFWFE